MSVQKQPVQLENNPETFCQTGGTTCLDQKEISRSEVVCKYCFSLVTFGDSDFCCSSCELLFHWSQTGQAPGLDAKRIPEKWLVFSHEDLEKSFNISTKKEFKKFRFYLDGLRCSSCVHLLEDFPKYCESVTCARVNFSECTLTVDCDTRLELGELCYLIEQLGYNPTPIKEKSDLERARVKDTRSDLMRIGVAGAIAGNEMLFSTPIYAGLVGSLGLVFKWISFVLFLPLLAYVALPFYQRAWASLKLRRVNVDMMIVVALWAGFIFSTISLIQQTDEIYFDSTASFIFLILLTRFLLKRQHDRLTSQNIFADLFSKDVFEVKTDGKTAYLRFDQIHKDQTYRVKKGQLIPCDSLLVSGQADFDLAFLTGEPYPEIRHQNNLILAGSRLLSSKAEFRSEELAFKSQLAISLNRLDQERTFKNKIQTLSDIVSHRLTLVVFSIAGLFFTLTFSELGIESFKRCLALITIACPCAVAFGTPLAHTLGLRKATEKGFFIKSEDIFERLSQVKSVIFDKTGTLTTSRLEFVKTEPAELSSFHKSLILGLEKSSTHPVAMSLKNTWALDTVLDFKDIRETPGSGVEGYFEGRYYEFKKSKSSEKSGDLKVDFKIDNEFICSVYFQEKIRPESKEVIRDFSAEGFSIFMLTGDQNERALEIARQTHISEAHVFANQTSATKKLFIQNHNPCLYVGDGLNDLEALNSAHASFAIKGTFESTLQISDVYAPQKNLLALRDLFVLGRQINETVKWNLFLRFCIIRLVELWLY